MKKSRKPKMKGPKMPAMGKEPGMMPMAGMKKRAGGKSKKPKLPF